MTNTAEIVTKVETARSVITDTRSQAAAALERAGEMTEQAAAHGWEGVATSMQMAKGALEAVIASLGTADDAAGEAVGVLRGITDQMSAPEVAEHLGQVLDRLDQVRTAADAANSSTDDARQACEQAGVSGGLADMMQGISDGIDGAQRGVDDAKSAAEAERQEAAAWGS